MTKKIFRSTVAVGLAVLAASLVIIMGALYSYFGKLQEQQLKDELSIAAAAMAEGDGMSYLTRLDSDNYRITWLRADGVVLYDTRADAATMENHAQREEVRQALANGAGESSRYSNTMLTKMLYYAQRLPDGTVLSINPAAQAVLGTDSACVGQPLVAVERDTAVSRALRDAMENGRAETCMEKDGREYQFDMTRIQADGETVGAVLLTFDVTEQTFAQRNRREFTANVSHELKTPLQGIIGSAELLESGMVQPEDMPRFVGHIRSKAQRLVTLINDIIRLSELDEGGALPMEPVELLTLCRDTAAGLSAAAEKRHVTVSVTGEEVTVPGVRRLLSEVFANLCDNAIKYNVDGGSVAIHVSRKGDNACVTVSDTGIGIPAEHQSRVFERFYRVDKSHSKSSGGTGLGLSIVKHAVAYHHGTVELDSREGKGTTFTVTLPLNQ